MSSSSLLTVKHIILMRRRAQRQEKPELAASLAVAEYWAARAIADELIAERSASHSALRE